MCLHFRRYGTGIRKSADPKVKDLMFDFFSYVNSPITSKYDIGEKLYYDFGATESFSSISDF